MSMKILSSREVSDLMNRLATDGIPPEAVEIYRARNVVAKLPGKGVNIKAYKVPGLVKGIIYGYLRKPKAMRAYDNAFELRRLEIETPEPLGVLIEKKNGCLARSFYVCRQLEGWHELRGAEERSDFTQLATALAAFVLLMHRNGVLMKDMTPGNILFHADGDTYRFALVDINRMCFGISDTARLRANLGLVFDSEDAGAAFARIYAGLAGCDAEAAEAQAREAFRKRWAQIRRKQRIRALLGIKHH